MHPSDAFNRTIVELKLGFGTTGSVSANPFNRTIVELKHAQRGDAFRDLVAFNRTIVELKLRVNAYIIKKANSF